MKSFHTYSILPLQSDYVGLGLMSGSSLDGLDIAAVKFYLQNQKIQKFDILAAKTYEYEEKWVSRLENLANASALDFAKTHVFYGHFIGEKIIEFCKTYKIRPEFVACHGHTIFHQPEKHFTFQVGCGQTISSYLRCPLVNDFRTKDLAHGGQGAPLVPLVEKELFPDVDIFINLGGFANISIYKENQVLGFDITACNRVLNYYTWKFSRQSYDKNGEIASHGDISYDLLEKIHQVPYFEQKPPKSLGNEWLEKYIFPLLDEYVVFIGYPSILRTWVEHITIQIINLLKPLNSCKFLVTGGGAKNVFLIQNIKRHLGDSIQWINIDEKLIDFKESLIFAYLGLKTLLGQKHNTLENITGGKNCILGSIHLG
jgi:anhydro-N-acetylmuramic acid kinase